MLLCTGPIFWEISFVKATEKSFRLTSPKASIYQMNKNGIWCLTPQVKSIAAAKSL